MFSTFQRLQEKVDTAVKYEKRILDDIKVDTEARARRKYILSRNRLESGISFNDDKANIIGGDNKEIVAQKKEIIGEESDHVSFEKKNM